MLGSSVPVLYWLNPAALGRIETISLAPNVERIPSSCSSSLAKWTFSSMLIVCLGQTSTSFFLSLPSKKGWCATDPGFPLENSSKPTHPSRKLIGRKTYLLLLVLQCYATLTHCCPVSPQIFSCMWEARGCCRALHAPPESPCVIWIARGLLFPPCPLV